jgi:hypothetical protein
VNPQVFVALLAKYTSLAEADAEKLAKELDLAIQPTSYKDAKRVVEEIVSKIKK